MGLVFLCVFNILYLGTGSYVAQARRALSVANDNLDSLYAKVIIRPHYTWFCEGYFNEIKSQLD